MRRQKLVARLERYLEETLGVSVAAAPWKAEARLPYFLQDRYVFFEAHLLGPPCLFMVSAAGEEEAPAAIRKHMEPVREKWGGPVVYVRERVTAYNRKRLIAQKVPFIVPGNQMYLPMLGIDLREHFRTPRSEKPKVAPSTQAVLIHALLHGAGDLGLTELALELEYSTMTMSRAFNELEAAGLGESLHSGRERRLRLTARGPDLWANAQAYLRSPVKSTRAIGVRRGESLPGPRAGLTALAHYSLLAEPPSVIVAMSGKRWRSLGLDRRQMKVSEEEWGALHIEVWAYDPVLFARDDVVDPLSLRLSLGDAHDERVEAAIDEMMDGVKW